MLATGPVVTAVTALALRVDKVVSPVTLARLISAVTLVDVDAARQAAYGLLNATKVAMHALPCTECMPGARIPDGCASPRDIATAVVQLMKATPMASARGAGDDATPVATGNIVYPGMNTADQTTVMLMCRVARMLCCGYPAPVSIASDGCLTSSLINHIFSPPVERSDDPSSSPAPHAAPPPFVQAVIASGAGLEEALSSILLQHLSIPTQHCGHSMACSITGEQADGLVHWLLACVDHDSRAVSLEAVRCLAEIGWDAVRHVPSGSDTILSHVLVRCHAALP